MKKIINRRDFLCCLGANVVAFSLTSFTNAIENKGPRSITDKSNILLIVSDDQGWGDASCNWKETDIETPVMDEVARTGIRFTQFYVNPLCAPTRSSFFTGQYSMENGMWRGPSKDKPDTRCIRSNVKILP